MFEKSCFNGVQEKANIIFFFFKWGNMSIISSEYVQLSKLVYIHNLLDVHYNPMNFKLSDKNIKI